MPRYTMVGRNEFPSTDPARVGKMDIAYAYMDETMKTIMIILPVEEDTPGRVEAELRKRVEAATKAGPREIEI